MYSVFRTIQDIMILNTNDKRIEKHFLLPGINNNPLITMNDIMIV
jgi:hypothetical protein